MAHCNWALAELVVQVASNIQPKRYKYHSSSIWSPKNGKDAVNSFEDIQGPTDHEHEETFHDALDSFDRHVDTPAMELRGETQIGHDYKAKDNHDLINGKSAFSVSNFNHRSAFWSHWVLSFSATTITQEEHFLQGSEPRHENALTGSHGKAPRVFSPDQNCTQILLRYIPCVASCTHIMMSESKSPSNLLLVATNSAVIMNNFGDDINRTRIDFVTLKLTLSFPRQKSVWHHHNNPQLMFRRRNASCPRLKVRLDTLFKDRNAVPNFNYWCLHITLTVTQGAHKDFLAYAKTDGMAGKPFMDASLNCTVPEKVLQWLNESNFWSILIGSNVDQLILRLIELAWESRETEVEKWKTFIIKVAREANRDLGDYAYTTLATELASKTKSWFKRYDKDQALLDRLKAGGLAKALAENEETKHGLKDLRSTLLQTANDIPNTPSWALTWVAGQITPKLDGMILQGAKVTVKSKSWIWKMIMGFNLCWAEQAKGGVSWIRPFSKQP